MKIRLRPGYTMAGPLGPAQSGETVDRPEALAVALVRGGYAEAVDPMPADAPGAETADAPPDGETASLKSRRKRG